MAFVAVAATVGGAVGLTGLAATIGGGALIGAGVGGLYSAITGDGDILNSMLTGGLIGGAGAFGLNAMGVGAAPAVTAPTALAGAPASTALVPTANAMTATPALQATGLKAAASAAPGISAIPGASSTLGTLAAPAAMAPSLAPVVTGSVLPAGYGAASTAAGMSGGKMLGYGLAGTTALSLLGGKQKGPGAGQLPDPGMVRPYDYSSTANEPTGAYPSPYSTAEYTYEGNPILDTRERNYFSQNFEPMQPYSAKTGTVNPNEPFKMAAAGGLMFDDESGMDEARGLTQGNLQKGLFGMGYADGGKVKHMFGGGLTSIMEKLMAQNPQMFMPKYEYDNASQRYTTVDQQSPEMLSGAIGARDAGLPSYRFDPAERKYQALAAGGHLGDYSDGGRLLKGPGDGVSDDIPATIANKQPARLADGEFVIPARIVSELGNGSTDAGAKRLYAMMDRIQNGRKKSMGKNNVAKDTKAKKHLLA
jgi:hypothetical protein